jgi:YD repeat-containing protein
MSKRFFANAFVVAALICSVSLQVKGQSQDCGRILSWYVNQQPPTAYDCNYFWNLLVTCLIDTSACPPAAGPQETHCGPSCSAAGRPIDLATGNTYVQQVDVRIPGLSNGLRLVRTWNSQWPSTQSTFQVGLFGPNWRSTFEERVFLGSDNYMKYSRSDGSFWSFGYNTSTAAGNAVYSVAAPANVTATLTQGSSSWTLLFENGEQRLFDNTSGNLTAIIDRNGNTTSLSYDMVGRLVTVTDPASRHLYFTYGSGSSYLVTAVTSDVGVSLAYAYDTQGRLNQVTEPDQSTISFQYDANSNISAVLDSEGKTLESHTYDSSGRGLTSSRANGVEALTASYSD